MCTAGLQPTLNPAHIASTWFKKTLLPRSASIACNTCPISINVEIIVYSHANFTTFNRQIENKLHTKTGDNNVSLNMNRLE